MTTESSSKLPTVREIRSVDSYLMVGGQLEERIMNTGTHMHSRTYIHTHSDTHIHIHTVCLRY